MQEYWHWVGKACAVVVITLLLVSVMVATALSSVFFLAAGWYRYQTEEIKVSFKPIGVPFNLANDLVERFPQNEVAIQETLREDHWQYVRQHLKIGSNYSIWLSNIDAVWWQKKSGRHRQVIIILPIAGSHDPGHILAQYFLRVEDYDVLQILGGSTKRFLDNDEFRCCSTILGLKNVVSEVSYFTQLRVASYGQAVMWLKNKGYEEVYLLGVSLGAIEGSLLALHPDIKASTLVMGGADLAEIMMYSREPFVVRWREELYKKMKEISSREPSDEEVLKLLRESLERSDPLRYAGAANPKKILMVIAKEDQTIPLRNAFKLWLSLNQPRLILFPTFHRGMAFYAPAVLYHAGRFFKQDH